MFVPKNKQRPFVPAVLKWNRSVIIRKVDPSIFEHAAGHIKAELMRCNSWCVISEVFKFQSSLKIVFINCQITDKCIASGLSLYYLHIPGSNIVKDRFVKLDDCYTCYAIDEHISTDCPKKLENPSYDVCSKCSEIGHDYRRCLNCGGGHHALAIW